MSPNASASSPAPPPSERATVKRVAVRGAYDRETLYRILDEGLIGYLGVVIDGAPRVIPFVYARIDDFVYIHGSTGNRVLRALRDGAPVCLTVAHLDALVLARSAFHSSVNYRSVVIHGTGEEVVDPEERLRALEATVEHTVPGRWTDVRPPNEEELRRTMVVRLPLAEASAKIRVGEPVEEPDDLTRKCWAGVLPVALRFGEPTGDQHLASGTPVPVYLEGYDRSPR